MGIRRILKKNNVIDISAKYDSGERSGWSVCRTV